MRFRVDRLNLIHLVIVVCLSTAISTVLTQDCDRITTCVDSQPLINCSMVNATGREITVYILENIPVNSVIYCLDDTSFFSNATTSYQASSQLIQHFSINASGVIVVIQSPNYESLQQITGIIRGVLVNGPASEPVTMIVNVVNVNEFAPQLQGERVRSFVLTEGEDTPQPFGLRVTDGDRTSNITYNISGTGSEEFVINIGTSVNRMIYQGLGLDRETYPMYQLTITAVDNLEPVKYSNPIHVNITVEDINDNAPRFTNNRTFTIPTVLPAGEIVGNASASDPDAGENGTVTYNIISVQFSPNDLFRINSTTGILYTTSAYTGNVFTEEIRDIRIVIMAKDNGGVPMNSSATFVVVLQRPPQFSNDTYMFSLEENNNRSVTVGTVTASFADGDSVSFIYQVEPTARSRFTVDSVTGEIRALVSLDRENSSVEIFTVMAVGVMDLRLVSNATVRIDVLDQNDQAPQFDESLYNFVITTANRVAGRISATDNDVGINSVVTFSIAINLDIPLNVSNVDDNTAEVIVIDQTRTGTFIFTVMATDVGGLQSTMRVTVTINPSTTADDGNMTTIVVVVVTTVSIVVILLILLIIICLCWRRHRNTSGQFPVHKQRSSFNGFATADSDYVPARKKSILKVPSGDNGKFGSPSCSEAASERVKFEPRANMVMFELDQPTIRKEASITTDTKLGSGDDSSICSGHNKHVDRDEGLILRSKNTVLTRATLSSNMTDSDDEDDFPSIPRNQLYTANNIRTQSPQPAPIGATNHAYSPPLSHRYNPVTPIVHAAPPLVDGGQMLSSENLDLHNRAMAKRQRKVPSDQYSETSDGTGTYFTSDAEDGSAYGEPSATWTTL